MMLLVIHVQEWLIALMGKGNDTFVDALSTLIHHMLIELIL